MAQVAKNASPGSLTIGALGRRAVATRNGWLVRNYLGAVLLALASVGEAAETAKDSLKKVALERVKELSCGELDTAIRLMKSRFEEISAIQYKSQQKTCCDVVHLKEMGDHLDDAAHRILETLHTTVAAHHPIHVVHAVGELTRVAKGISLAESAAKKVHAVGLLKELIHNKWVALAGSPTLIVGMFALDIAVKVTEGILKGRESREKGVEWTSLSVQISNTLSAEWHQAGNALGALTEELKNKKCESSTELSCATCVGDACARCFKEVDADLDKKRSAWSLGLGYKTVCSKLKVPSPSDTVPSDRNRDFSSTVTRECTHIAEQMVHNATSDYDLEQYPQFATFARSVAENKKRIAYRCIQETCNDCARQKIGKSAQSSKDYNATLRYCSEAHSVANMMSLEASAQAFGTGKFRPGFSDPNHIVPTPPEVTREQWERGNFNERLARGALTPKEENHRANERALERSRIAEQERRVQDLEPLQLPSLPEGVKLSCECVSRCVGSDSGPQRTSGGESRLGYLAYWHSKAESDLEHCGREHFKRKRVLCASGEEAVDTACSWRRSNEPFSKKVKCYVKAEDPEENFAVDRIESPLTFLQSLAACKDQKIEARYCFRSNTTVIHPTRGSGYREECWDVNGNTELVWVPYNRTTEKKSVLHTYARPEKTNVFATPGLQARLKKDHH